MNQPARKSAAAISGLPGFTFRQLEVFRLVCREGSYANAALERHSTRANIKRVCGDFERAMGRTLLEETADKSLAPTPFARELLEQARPLARALRRLGDCVKHEHESGRIVRFAAAGGFFKSGLFTNFLGRLRISDRFRPCFIWIEPQRFRNSLLNAECDVYFGIGLGSADRLDLIVLGAVGWALESASSGGIPLPETPAGLPAGNWWLACPGDPETSADLLAELHQRGARGGRILPADTAAPIGGWILRPDAEAAPAPPVIDVWPCFRFCAVLRKHHPYAELMPRLEGAALA